MLNEKNINHVFSASWVKLKWKNLRDTYCRILKHKAKSNGSRRKKWIFEDALSFLKFPYQPDYQAQYVELSNEYIEDINSEVINQEDLLQQLESNKEDDFNEYLDENPEDVVLEEIQIEEPESFQQFMRENANIDDITLKKQLTVDEYARQIQSKFRKIRPKNLDSQDNVFNQTSYGVIKPILKPCTQISQVTPIIINATPVFPIQTSDISKNLDIKSCVVTSENTKSGKSLLKKNIKKINYNYKLENDVFFKNIAEIVKKLPLKAQADIKMDICKIVREAEIQHKKEVSKNNLQAHSKMPGMIPKLMLVPCHIIDNQIS